MDELDPDDVMRAASSWIWVPDDAESVDTDDYLLVAYPAHFSSPTRVFQTSSDRPAGELVAEVTEHVRRWERPFVTWWCSSVTRPDDLEDALVAAGAEREETLAVLARPVTAPAPTDPSFDLRRVLDPDTLRDHERVAIAAFGGEMPPDDWIATEVTRLRGRYDTGQAMSVVAYRGDEPVGIGGVSIADGFARLWNGATAESARRQGVYTAVTAARARFAREQGARGLLTKARVETSAPILRRAGFTAYGEERSYRLDVST